MSICIIPKKGAIIKGIIHIQKFLYYSSFEKGMSNNNNSGIREHQGFYSIEDIADSHKLVLLDNCAIRMPSQAENEKLFDYMRPAIINSHLLLLNAFFKSVRGRKNIGMVPEVVSEWNRFKHRIEKFYRNGKAMLKDRRYKKAFDLGNDEYDTRQTRDVISQTIKIIDTFRNRFRKNFADAIKNCNVDYNNEGKDNEIFNLLYSIVSDSAIYLWQDGANEKYDPKEQKSDTDEKLLAYSFAFSLAGYGNIALITNDMRIHKMGSIIQRIMTSDIDIPSIFDELERNPVDLFCDHESLQSVYRYLKKPRYGNEYPADFPKNSFEKFMQLEQILSKEALKSFNT